LPVERLWGVGPVTAGKLRERRITTVGHIARVGEAALVTLLGPHAGRHLHALAHNHDPRRVRVGHRRGSIGSQCALGRRKRTADELEAVLAALADRVTRRMRGGNRAGRTVTLRLRFDDFSRATRSRSMLKATMQTRAVLSVARELLDEARPLIGSRGCTLIGLAVSNLDTDGFVQLELPFEPDDSDGLDKALDAIRDRFGGSSVTRAVNLGQDLGPSVPILSD
jgi:DNA polymerase-4